MVRLISIEPGNVPGHEKTASMAWPRKYPSRRPSRDSRHVNVILRSKGRSTPMYRVDHLFADLSWVDWDFLMFHRLFNSAWADGNLAKVAGHVCKLVEY